MRDGVPTAAIQGVLVQEQVDAGVELLVGLQAASGGYAPVLTVGIGGTAVEIYRDIANAACARDSRAGARIVANTSRLAVARRVPRWCAGRRRSRRPRDQRDLRLGDHLGDTLVDLEVNPLVVHSRGVHAVDFVCRLRNGAR